MSLRNFVNRPDVVALFGKHCRLTKPASAPMLAPPVGPKPAYMAIGTAFDYLSRWRIHQFLYSSDKISDDIEWEIFSRRWLSELALSRFSADEVSEEGFQEIYDKFWEIDDLVFDRFIETKPGELTEDVAKAALWLPHLDDFCRRGVYLPFKEVIDDAVEDLMRLDALLDPRLLLGLPGAASNGGDVWTNSSRSLRVWLNPTFKYAANVGGADADIIVDDSLVEIKVSVDNVRLDHLRQLLGYYALAHSGVVSEEYQDDTDNYSPVVSQDCWISRVGVYSARHGQLCMWPVSAFFASDEDRFAFVNGFLKIADIPVTIGAAKPRRKRKT